MMKRFILTSFLFCLASVLLGSNPAAADTIWWSDDNGHTGTLNTSTLTVTSEFNTLSGGTTNSMQDIAFGPANVLYGVDGHNQLYTINTSNGAPTAVGTPNNIGTTIYGLGFSNPTMYAGAGNQLYTVNLTAGTYAALPDPIGLPSGAEVAGDIQIAKNGVTYVTDTDGDLVSVNTSTGAGTIIGTNSTYGPDSILGLALGSSGTLWGLTQDGQLLTLNPSLGNGYVQAIDGVIDYPGAGPIEFYGAAAPVPEPGSLSVITALSLIGLARRRPRRNNQSVK
jgi:hypothetical protein